MRPARASLRRPCWPSKVRSRRRKAGWSRPPRPIAARRTRSARRGVPAESLPGKRLGRRTVHGESGGIPSHRVKAALMFPRAAANAPAVRYLRACSGPASDSRFNRLEARANSPESNSWRAAARLGSEPPVGTAPPRPRPVRPGPPRASARAGEREPPCRGGLSWPAPGPATLIRSLMVHHVLAACTGLLGGSLRPGLVLLVNPDPVIGKDECESSSTRGMWQSTQRRREVRRGRSRRARGNSSPAGPTRRPAMTLQTVCIIVRTVRRGSPMRIMAIHATERPRALAVALREGKADRLKSGQEGITAADLFGTRAIGMTVAGPTEPQELRCGPLAMSERQRELGVSIAPSSRLDMGPSRSVTPLAASRSGSSSSHQFRFPPGRGSRSRDSRNSCGWLRGVERLPEPSVPAEAASHCGRESNPARQYGRNSSADAPGSLESPGGSC